MMAQILLLRFSRIAFIFDLQFIIISLAILGYGLGNYVVYLWFNTLDDGKIRKLFTWVSLFYAIFSLIPFFILHFTNRYPQVIIAPLFFISELALYVLAGILISLTFRYRSANQKTYFIYLINMVGSGIGAFLIIFLLDYLGIYAIYINFVFALIAFLFYLHTNKLIKGAILLLAFTILVIFPDRLETYVQVVCNPNGK
jgi:MFS family permease